MKSEIRSKLLDTMDEVRDIQFDTLSDLTNSKKYEITAVLYNEQEISYVMEINNSTNVDKLVEVLAENIDARIDGYFFEVGDHYVHCGTGFTQCCHCLLAVPTGETTEDFYDNMSIFMEADC